MSTDFDTRTARETSAFVCVAVAGRVRCGLLVWLLACAFIAQMYTESYPHDTGGQLLVTYRVLGYVSILLCACAWLHINKAHG